MKRLLSIILLAGYCISLHAQSFSINTDGSLGDASSILDVKSTNKGVLIPRMTDLERNAIVNPKNGLLVYVNSDSSFYYYHNTWRKLMAYDEGWHLDGNSGTNGNNFVGTTDVQPLKFRVWGVNAGYLDFVRANSAYGSFSLNSITNGFGNTAIGYTSSAFTTSGSGNASVGTYSLRNNTTGSQNVAFGYLAGLSIQTGNNNTCIGSFTNVTDSSISNSTAIGTGATVSLSNCMVFGQGTTNVGIGTATPHGQLQLGNGNPNGNRRIILYEYANNDHQFLGLGVNTNLFRFQVDFTATDYGFFAGTSPTTSTELMRIKGNGNVGIGISTPAQMLDVNGSAVIRNNLGIGITNPVLPLDVNGKAVIRDSLGIGTTIPHAALQFANTNGRKVVMFEDLANDHRYYGFGIETSAIRYQVSDVVDDHIFYAGTSNTTSNELMRIKGSGSVGIGTNSPAQKLDVNGKAVVRDSLGIGITSPTLRLDVNGKAVIRDSLGIGTTTPHAALQFSNVGGRKIVLFEDAINDHQYYGLAIDPSTLRLQTGGDFAFFRAATASSSAELVRIKSNGNVGIGSTTINEKLSVNGAINISDGGYTGLTQNAVSPVPSGGAGTIAFSNGHFFGWNGTQWKQLDN